jgi:lipopolysaccharide biosynthesis protein
MEFTQRTEHNDGAIKPIAFYLPQYHPIQENDAWWGKGFTEWRNVTSTKPRFKGHYQPHLPSDLGFYDLRLPEARKAQADLARSYGIEGFCYYHYWFNGKQLLERPFQEVLSSGEPDFPFCLCWANENWTRRWDGMDQEVLAEQHYSIDDDLRHINWLLHAFHDQRYIKINGHPVLLIYKASALPCAVSTTNLWRDEARRSGFPDLFLINVESAPSEHKGPDHFGCDAAVEFQPDWSRLPARERQSLRWRILTKLGLSPTSYREDNIYSYEALISEMIAKPRAPYPRFPCVTPSWDNAARRKLGATILHGSTPALYEGWLHHVAKSIPSLNLPAPFLFINAWNEWAEGNHLEPCLKWGHGYLKATLNALNQLQD